MANISLLWTMHVRLRDLVMRDFPEAYNGKVLINFDRNTHRKPTRGPEPLRFSSGESQRVD